MKQIHILVVTNDEADYRFIQELLSNSAEYQLDWVRTYREGETALLMRSYDLALVNDNLGIFHGAQFIREEEQMGNPVPVILFNDNNSWLGHEDAFSSDAAYCLLRKEMTAERLKKLIHEEQDWQRANLIYYSMGRGG